MRRLINKLMPHLIGFFLLFSFGFMFIDITEQSIFFRAMGYSILMMLVLDIMVKPQLAIRRWWWILGCQFVLTAIYVVLLNNS